jgi:hypothetical protein
MCANADHYTYTLKGFEESGREEGEEDGGQENDNCIDVSSD